jgi:hypothetical protein
MQSTFVPNLNSSDLEIVSSQRLCEYEQSIMCEYGRIMESIEKNTKIYDIQMKKNQEAVDKVDKLEQEIDVIVSEFSDEYGRSFCITA